MIPIAAIFTQPGSLGSNTADNTLPKNRITLGLDTLVVNPCQNPAASSCSTIAPGFFRNNCTPIQARYNPPNNCIPRNNHRACVNTTSSPNIAAAHHKTAASEAPSTVFIPAIRPCLADVWLIKKKFGPGLITAAN